MCFQLADALQASTQAAAELSLQQKLREDSELRVEELEESLLEKEQEVQRQQDLVSRLQGEVLIQDLSLSQRKLPSASAASGLICSVIWIFVI